MLEAKSFNENAESFKLENQLFTLTVRSWAAPHGKIESVRTQS